jgi:hypothetical protein
VEEQTWGRRPVPSGLEALNGSFQDVDVLQVCSEISRCTAPPAGYGFELASLWPWLRYAAAFDDGPELRLRAEWSDLDSHQKTILSDDFGMGVPIVVLRAALGLVDVVPTQYVVRRLVRLGRAQLKLRRSGKRGPLKTPDFLGLDAAGCVHVIECKGTQSPSRLAKAMRTGIPQKSNVRISPAGLKGESVVAGLYVPQADGGRPICSIIDPEPEDPEFSLTLDPETTRDVAGEAEIAGVLHLLGAAVEATSIAEGEWTGENRKRLLTRAKKWSSQTSLGNSVVFEERTLDLPRPFKSGGAVTHGIQARVGMTSGVLEAIERSLSPERLDSELRESRPAARALEAGEGFFQEVTRGGAFFEMRLLRG